MSDYDVDEADRMRASIRRKNRAVTALTALTLPVAVVAWLVPPLSVAYFVCLAVAVALVLAAWRLLRSAKDELDDFTLAVTLDPDAHAALVLVRAATGSTREPVLLEEATALLEGRLELEGVVRAAVRNATLDQEKAVLDAAAHLRGVL